MARKTGLKVVATGPRLPAPPEHLGADGLALWEVPSAGEPHHTYRAGTGSGCSGPRRSGCAGS